MVVGSRHEGKLGPELQSHSYKGERTFINQYYTDCCCCTAIGVLVCTAVVQRYIMPLVSGSVQGKSDLSNTEKLHTLYSGYFLLPLDFVLAVGGKVLVTTSKGKQATPMMWRVWLAGIDIVLFDVDNMQQSNHTALPRYIREWQSVMLAVDDSQGDPAARIPV